MGSSYVYDEEYDGKFKRWRVQCDFECEEGRCPVVGEWHHKPEGKKAREVGIYCRRHAREDGRTTDGRNSHLRTYVMTLSADDKKRAREDVKHEQKRKKKKVLTPGVHRKKSVQSWLGTLRFEECSVFHRDMILDELRVPPLLLGRGKDPARVYLCDSFRLDDLKYLFKKRRSDGRQLFFVRGNSIIR